MLEIMQTFHFLHNLWNKMKINVIIRYDLIVLSYCFMYQILYRTFGNHAMKLELEETFRPKKIVKDKEKRFLSWCILRWVKDEYLRISRTDLHWQNQDINIMRINVIAQSWNPIQNLNGTKNDLHQENSFVN